MLTSMDSEANPTVLFSPAAGHVSSFKLIIETLNGELIADKMKICSASMPGSSIIYYSLFHKKTDALITFIKSLSSLKERRVFLDVLDKLHVLFEEHCISEDPSTTPRLYFSDEDDLKISILRKGQEKYWFALENNADQYVVGVGPFAML
ncbi:hypothetical protein FGB62_66g149 [Gracilaria domingensis]|nr:hypothetical protein FGB62_66g149 [Gracilaria domingensis]